MSVSDECRRILAALNRLRDMLDRIKRPFVKTPNQILTQPIHIGSDGQVSFDVSNHNNASCGLNNNQRTIEPYTKPRRAAYATVKIKPRGSARFVQFASLLPIRCYGCRLRLLCGQNFLLVSSLHDFLRNYPVPLVPSCLRVSFSPQCPCIGCRLRLP